MPLRLLLVRRRAYSFVTAVASMYLMIIELRLYNICNDPNAARTLQAMVVSFADFKEHNKGEKGMSEVKAAGK